MGKLAEGDVTKGKEYSDNMSTNQVMNGKGESLRSLFNSAPLYRIRSNQHVYLPFGLGVRFWQHYIDERTTVHASSGCHHCSNMGTLRAASAHAAGIMRGGRVDRVLLILPERATETLRLQHSEFGLAQKN